MVQPPLTEADRTSMALQALQNQRRPEQQIEVRFSDRPPGQARRPTAPIKPLMASSPPAMPESPEPGIEHSAERTDSPSTGWAARGVSW
jgi:hypothetical protein